MKCHICNKKIDSKEDYVTKVVRKMFSAKRLRMHKECWDKYWKKFQI